MSPRTQTPWKAAKMEGAAYYEGKSRDGWIIVGPQTVPDYEETFYEEEDARILAAAPDLLAALVALRAYLSKCPPHAEDRTGAEWGRMMDLSGAALARAEEKS